MEWIERIAWIIVVVIVLVVYTRLGYSHGHRDASKEAEDGARQ